MVLGLQLELQPGLGLGLGLAPRATSLLLQDRPLSAASGCCSATLGGWSLSMTPPTSATPAWSLGPRWWSGGGSRGKPGLGLTSTSPTRNATSSLLTAGSFWSPGWWASGGTSTSTHGCGAFRPVPPLTTLTKTLTSTLTTWPKTLKTPLSTLSKTLLASSGASPAEAGSQALSGRAPPCWTWTSNQPVYTSATAGPFSATSLATRFSEEPGPRCGLG